MQTPYIVSARYDWAFFLLPPLLALGLGMAITAVPLASRELSIWGGEFGVAELAIGIFIHAHLVIVFFRSHGNPQIFQTARARFLLVPVLLFAAILSSPWVLVSCAVLATFWDVYHSGMQTFGFARIYDQRQGNAPLAGRRLDWHLNQLIYAGPILAGATMMDHFEDFELFDHVGSVFFTQIPVFMEGHQRYFTWAVLGLGTAFSIYYVFAYWRLHQKGYEISLPKVYLLATTGLCSIYTWGFNTWGQAFFIMNFFHALQYFGLVWASEKKNLIGTFGMAGFSMGKPITLLLFLGLGFGYGFFAYVVDAGVTWWWGVTIVVSLMHFWYDGFIWSVRKQQV